MWVFEAFARIPPVGSGTSAALVGPMLDSKFRPQVSREVTDEQEQWVVRVERAGGKFQEYRCATEAQARQLELALNEPEAVKRGDLR
jgi:hypothetical protein